MNKKKFGSILAGVTMLASCGSSESAELRPTTPEMEHYFGVLTEKVANEGGVIDLPDGMVCDFDQINNDRIKVLESPTGDIDNRVVLVEIDGYIPDHGILSCMDGIKLSGSNY